MGRLLLVFLEGHLLGVDDEGLYSRKGAVFGLGFFPVDVGLGIGGEASPPRLEVGRILGIDQVSLRLFGLSGRRVKGLGVGLRLCVQGWHDD